MSVVQLKILVPDIDSIISSFSQIRIEKSESGTPFTDAYPITADEPTAPVLTGANEGPFYVSGKAFILRVNDKEQSVAFTSPDPLAALRVVQEINTQVQGVTASVYEGKIRLTGDQKGTASILQLISGDALSPLGFTVGQRDVGEEAHIELRKGVTRYEFNDNSGSPDHWYRTRFYNPVTLISSSWSDWILGSAGTVLPATNLIKGTIRLANLDGTAWTGARICVVNVYNPLSSGNYLIGGPNVKFETDGTGYGEVTLVKGAVVDVIIERTSIVRRITVPTSGTEFDLLDPSLVLDDPFNIQVPDLPAAWRTTL